MFNTQNNQWSKISPCNIASCESSVCNYNDQYIYKFGGLNSEKRLCQVPQSISQEVEQYDVEQNKWYVIKIIQNQPNHYQFLRQS